MLALLALALTARPAAATPYEVLYDANTDGVFPEDLGWQRLTSQGGAHRTVENGIFTLMAQNPNPNGGSDQYLWDAMESLDAGPGEMFYTEWRVRLLPGSNSSDVGVFIATDGMQRAFNLAYSVSSIFNSRDNQRLDLDTTNWHTYRIESFDMVDYAFFIDGDLAWEGFFGLGTTRSSEVLWGDGGHFGASASEWDYFQLGVLPVPAPAPFVALCTAFVLLCRRPIPRGVASG